jgi:hypothetical protein
MRMCSIRRMRWRATGALIGLALGLGACGLKVSNTEYLLSQAGFRKVPADTPQRAEHLQTVAAHKLIRRQSGDGKRYYVYADPNYCQCMYVGSESAYATYKTLVQQQDEAMALQEEREHENFQGDK